MCQSNLNLKSTNDPLKKLINIEIGVGFKILFYYILGIIIFMLGSAYLSVPLYQIYCRSYGLGGTYNNNVTSSSGVRFNLNLSSQPTSEGTSTSEKTEQVVQDNSINSTLVNDGIIKKPIKTSIIEPAPLKPNTIIYQTTDTKKLKSLDLLKKIYWKPVIDYKTKLPIIQITKNDLTKLGPHLPLFEVAVSDSYNEPVTETHLFLKIEVNESTSKNYPQGYDFTSTLKNILILNKQKNSIPLRQPVSNIFKWNQSRHTFSPNNQDLSVQQINLFTKGVDTKGILVKFASNKDSSLTWDIIPSINSIKVIPGDTSLIFYIAKNLSSEPIKGIATYQVSPAKAGIYLNKIQCFCFQEQLINGNETVELPILFYLDSDFSTDPKMNDLESITLSYMFYPVGETTSG